MPGPREPLLDVMMGKNLLVPIISGSIKVRFHQHLELTAAGQVTPSAVCQAALDYAGSGLSFSAVEGEAEIAFVWTSRRVGITGVETEVVSARHGCIIFASRRGGRRPSETVEARIPQTTKNNINITAAHEVIVGVVVML